MTNCNYNNDKNSSAMGIKNPERFEKKNSDKTNIIKEIDKVDSIDHEKKIILDDKNAIPFFFNYGKENLEDKVRISTRFGNIDLQLFNNTPYHRANFIYLTKMKYFNKTTFHRVVPIL